IVYLFRRMKKIINAVYGLPWEHMSVRNQKIVLFFLQNVQVPFNLRALDMVPIGAQTMVVNEKIINAVYGLPWEHMSVRNQKIVLFFLQNVQVPFNLKALDMVPIGAQTMVVIIRTSFSYFIMLRTIAYD
ncbi:hypothetical protein RR46_02589, partial [Papilio xuthus]